jgi:tyrosyl-tRNA synthetase
LNQLNETEVLAVFEGVPNFTVERSLFNAGINATDLLAGATTVFPSKGEAKKMIQGGGVALNKTKIGAVDEVYTNSHLINGKFLVVQKGKKNYFLIIAE